jgi:hypothetical protein
LSALITNRQSMARTENQGAGSDGRPLWLCAEQPTAGVYRLDLEGVWIYNTDHTGYKAAWIERACQYVRRKQ